VEWPTQLLVAVDLEGSIPVAFINLYEVGDVWMKVQGCEKCQMEAPARCCGRCPFATMDGCAFHFKGFTVGRVSSKPLSCVVTPTIERKRTEKCSLIYKCTQGSMKGKYRRVSDHADVFRESI
jgi:hypothetical protein